MQHPETCKRVLEASLKDFDDIKTAVDHKLCSVALFIDLTNGFDAVDHQLLVNLLLGVVWCFMVFFRSHSISQTDKCCFWSCHLG